MSSLSFSFLADGRSRGNDYDIREVNRREGLEITAKTAVPRWYGDEMDGNLAVLALIQRANFANNIRSKLDAQVFMPRHPHPNANAQTPTSHQISYKDNRSLPYRIPSAGGTLHLCRNPDIARSQLKIRLITTAFHAASGVRFCAEGTQAPERQR